MLKIILLIWCYLHLIDAQIWYKLCSPKGLDDACQQLGRTHDLACRTNAHNIDCLLNIETNISHVGRINSEEAFLGANLVSNNVQVIGEIHSKYDPSEIVVLVRNTIGDGIGNLKGKHFCHPGFTHDNLSPSLIQDLENQIIRTIDNYCVNDNITLIEKHIRGIAGFFGDSCRPGVWTQDTTLDKLLKQKYSNLCQLCESQSCNSYYKAPFEDSLKCLKDKGGDVAITTIYDARIFMNQTSNQQNFKYFCKNGTSSGLLPCVWSKQLHSVIVAEKSSISFVSNFLSAHLGDKLKIEQTMLRGVSDRVIHQALVSILKLNNQETVKLLQNNEIKSLKNYVGERREVPTLENSKRCNIALRWCTKSLQEQNKCKWLSQAALNRQIQPVVECKQTQNNNDLSCFNDIQRDNVDIVTASADYGYLALRKKLIALAYPETDTRYVSTILIVKRDNDTTINSLDDLKQKRACIPEFAGKEFLAFVDTVRQKKLIDIDTCEYGQIFSDFVSDSCTPGVLSEDQGNFVNVDTEKLCKQCVPTEITKTAVYCNADYINKYFGSNGSLLCLQQNNADFAVISKTTLSKINDTNLRVICRNGNLAPSPGLQVDTNCALATITDSEIVAKYDNKKNPDIMLALREFERWFGQDLYAPFHIFDSFNNTLDLLFKDTTPGLDFTDKSDYVKNFEQLLDNAANCISGDVSSGNIQQISFISFSAIVLIYCLFYH